MPDSNTPSPVTAGSPVLIPSGQFKDQAVFALTDLSVLVGEDACCELQLLAATHGVHALLVTSPEGVYVRNFAQSGHIRVNGRPVREENLANGDDLQIAQFTFKYVFENQIDMQPATATPAAVDFTGGQLPIAGRSALIGTSAQADLRLHDPNTAERHAVFFFARGQWHVRDLGSAFGTLVNGGAVRQTQIKPGDLIQVGGTSMRWTDRIRPRPQSPVGGAAVFADAGMGGMVLGGMPVSLPPAAQPPKTFGRISVAFDGRTLPNRRDSEPPAETPMAEPAPKSDEDASGDESPTSPRTPLLRRFPPVPKIKRAPAEQTEEPADTSADADYVPGPGPFGVQTIDGLGEPVLLGSEEVAASDVFGEGLQHLSGISGDAFGGQPISSSDHIPMSDSTPDYDADSEDFAESKFWDMTDDQQADVPLPAREKDFSPPIPPVGTTFTVVGGDMGNASATVIGDAAAPDAETASPVSVSDAGEGLPGATFHDNVFGEPPAAGADVPPAAEEESGNGEASTRPPRPHAPLALDRSPLRRPAPGAQLPPDVSSLIAPAAPQGPPRRAVAILMSLMLVCMAIASAWIWLMVPSHYTLEGRVSFVNVPAPGTADWTAFQNDQRGRLASPAVLRSAATALQTDHPGASPGFLAAGSKPFADAAQAARFDVNPDGSADLVIDISGTNATRDSERLGELLRALFAADNDLTTAAAAAQKALTDWEPNIISKQQELNDLDSQIAGKRQVIAAAKAIAPRVAALSSAADEAGSRYLDAEKAIAADETQLLTINARLSTQPPATTQPSSDPQWSDLHQQITDDTGSMVSLESQDDVVAVSRTHAALAADQARLDQAVSAASDVLQKYPDLSELINSSVALQSRVAQMLDQLAQRRQVVQGKLEEFARLIEETSRRREEALCLADPQIPSLRDQLSILQNRIAAAEQDDSTVSDGDRTEMRHEASRITRQLEALRHPFRDDVSSLRQQVNLLIEGARADLNADTQLIDDTLQALIARLNAAPPPPSDMTLEQKRQVLGLAILIQYVAQDQANYAAAVSNGGEDTEAIASLQQEAAVLSEQADARAQIISATPVSNDDQRRQLARQHDDLLSRIARERDEMETAHADFLAKASASVSAALAVQNGRDATKALNALMDTRSTKQDDLSNLMQNRADLEARIKSAPDVIPPNELSVRIVSDDTYRKWEYTVVAVLCIGLVFGILALISGGPRAAGGSPPHWQDAQAKSSREAQTPTPVAG